MMSQHQQQHQQHTAAPGGGSNTRNIRRISTPTTTTTTTPTTTTTTPSPQKIVSAKLNILSTAERSRIEDELHGLPTTTERNYKLPVEEEMLLLQKQLSVMNQTLIKLQQQQPFDDHATSSSWSTNDNTNTAVRDGNSSNIIVRVHFHHQEDTSAYQTALGISQAYVEQLKVCCLRAEAYDGKKAAYRLVRFFHRKRWLFGEDKLTKDITMGDLNDEDLEALERGLCQILKHPDRAGRTVILLYGRISQFYSTETVMRVVFYVKMMALQYGGVDVQRRGAVSIYYGYGQTETFPGRPIEYLNSWGATPLRIVACHCCGEDSTLLSAAASQFYENADPSNVFRFRRHFGSQISECMYKLMTFGIPVLTKERTFSLTPDGCIDLHTHLDTMKMWNENQTMPLTIATTRTRPARITTAASQPPALLQNATTTTTTFLASTAAAYNSTPSTRNSNIITISSTHQQEERHDHFVVAAGRRMISSSSENTSIFNNNNQTKKCMAAPSSLSLSVPDNANTNIMSQQSSWDERSTRTARGMKLPSSSSTTTAALSSNNECNSTTTTTTTTYQQHEDTTSTKPVVVVPSPMDILLGRGRPPNSSPGTRRLHELLHRHQATYESASKFEKTVIAETILMDLKENDNIRFLKLTTRGFEVCTDAVARAKISHAFRNLRKATAV